MKDVLLWRVSNALSRLCMPLCVSLGEMFPPAKKMFKKAFYDAISRCLNAENIKDLRLMNYGYAYENGTQFSVLLDETDMAEFLYSWHLVYETVKEADLMGKSVLVTGCGRGGDAHFIHRYAGASRVAAIDLSAEAIAFCKAEYASSKAISFEQGDAENLCFDSTSFDAVVSIESSHGYAHPLRFYQEVFRVLRRGGLFLYADYFRHKKHQNDLRSVGFHIRTERDITPHVVKAGELGAEFRKAQISKIVPSSYRAGALEWSGIKGSVMHESFQNGSIIYKRFVLERPLT